MNINTLIEKQITSQYLSISQNLHKDILKLIFPFTNRGSILFNFRTDDSTISFDPAFCTREENEMRGGT